MSRCLPFPPPGYVWNGVSGEALLGLIKVQRERGKAEREKKKEKRRRNKEKKKAREQGEIWVKKRGHHKRHKRLRNNEGEGIIRSENHGKSEYEAQEIMERSSLTEELDKQPISDSLYESSDNSQSTPRKRSSIYRIECHNHGSVVQIDFQLQKHKTPEGLSSKPGCSIRMMDSEVQNEIELPVEEQFSSASGDVQEFIPPRLKELGHSSQRARFNMDEKSEMTRAESEFRELVVNWIPPLQIEHFDVDDQEWLFETKPPRSDILETTSASKDVLHHGNSMSCPYDLFLLHSSAMMDLEVQMKLELDAAPVKQHISSATDSDAQELATPPPKLLCQSSSHGVGVETDDKSKIAPSPTTLSESHFTESIVNWLPPSLQLEPFDQEWLFNTKQPRRGDTRDTSILHQGNFTQYPHLPQSNIHALPYSILY